MTEAQFNKTIELLKNHIKIDELPQDDQLTFYKYFKQSTCGDCNISAPSFWDIKGKAKYNAWKEVSGISQEEARGKYIEQAKKFLPKDVADEI